MKESGDTSSTYHYPDFHNFPPSPIREKAMWAFSKLWREQVSSEDNFKFLQIDLLFFSYKILYLTHVACTTVISYF